MFYSLTGEVVFSDLNSVAVSCGGVAFRCQSSANTLREIRIGETVTLYTYLNVREDALDLFGFLREYELEWFRLLIGVTGVGPKAALAILSQLTPEKLALCVSTGDVKAITKANGVGLKLAQRVILELKDKAKSAVSSLPEAGMLESAEAVCEAENTSEAVAALTMLGYAKSEAAVAVGKVDPELSVQDIIKQALKILSRRA